MMRGIYFRFHWFVCVCVFARTCMCVHCSHTHMFEIWTCAPCVIHSHEPQNCPIWASSDFLSTIFGFIRYCSCSFNIQLSTLTCHYTHSLSHIPFCRHFFFVSLSHSACACPCVCVSVWIFVDMEMPCDMRINNKTKQMSAGILYTVIVLFRTENYHEIVEIRFYHLWEIMDSVSRPHID